MRRLVLFSAVAVLASLSPARAQSPEDSLRLYAVNVVKTTPFEKPFTGYGIYLGRGAVLTAAHVIGRLAFLKNPRVLIAGLDLPAKVVKAGSPDAIDLMLLSVDEDRLPVNLRLRRNPICKRPPTVGENVIGVLPERITRYRIISPLLIYPALRATLNTLIDEPAVSGSGVFDANRRCLLGIISKATDKFEYRREGDKVVMEPNGSAGYFVPASQIADFLPAEYRF
jgi:hypothetical protein